MKRIERILSGRENYEKVTNNLSVVLEPFALLLVGQEPIYKGEPVNTLQMMVGKTSDGKEASKIFMINGEAVAAVDLINNTVSANGSDYVKLEEYDQRILQKVLSGLEKYETPELDIFAALFGNLKGNESNNNTNN